MQPGHHVIHHVYLTTQGGHEEALHHAGRRQPQRDRPPGGDHQLVDRGDALLGIEEQPLPVESHDLDLQRWLIAGQRSIGVEGYRAAPGQGGQHGDHHQRDTPDRQIGAQGKFPLRPIAGAAAVAVAPQDERCQYQHRQHHRQGNGDDPPEVLPLSGGDGALGIEKGEVGVAAARDQRQQQPDDQARRRPA